MANKWRKGLFEERSEDTDGDQQMPLYTTELKHVIKLGRAPPHIEALQSRPSTVHLRAQPPTKDVQASNFANFARYRATASTNICKQGPAFLIFTFNLIIGLAQTLVVPEWAQQTFIPLNSIDFGWNHHSLYRLYRVSSYVQKNATTTEQAYVQEAGSTIF